MTARTAIASTRHERVGHTGKGLWGVPGMQLPAYIQHVANDLREKGKTESKAIEMAVGIVQNWARGVDGRGNKVSPEVQAAAAKAIAEWEAKRARAHATPNKGGGGRNRSRESNLSAVEEYLDLAHAPYRFRHGWIPLHPSDEPKLAEYRASVARHANSGDKNKAIAGAKAIAARASHPASKKAAMKVAHDLEGPKASPAGPPRPKGLVDELHQAVAAGDHRKALRRAQQLLRAARTPNEKKMAQHYIDRYKDFSTAMEEFLDMATVQYNASGDGAKSNLKVSDPAKLNTAARRKLAKSGAAMKGGSSGGRYPIRNATDLRKAIRAVGRGKGSHEAIRAHICKRAKALGLQSMIPSNWSCA